MKNTVPRGSLAHSCIKRGFLYDVRENKDTGEYQIVRYRIKNWSLMK